MADASFKNGHSTKAGVGIFCLFRSSFRKYFDNLLNVKLLPQSLDLESTEWSYLIGGGGNELIVFTQPGDCECHLKFHNS